MKASVTDIKGITIRAAVAGDEGVLATMAAAVQGAHIGHRPDIFKPIDIGGLASWFAATIREGSARLWIAKRDSAPVGYVLVLDQRRAENVFCYERRWLEIDQLGVDPEYRRLGIARSLVSHVITVAKAEGVPDVELNTWTFNETAQLAFQRLGFGARNVRFERKVTRA